MNALLSTSSSLLPPAFLTGIAAGTVGYGCSWLGFKVTISAAATDSLKSRLAKLDECARLNFWSLGPSTAHAIVQCTGTYRTVMVSNEHRSDRAGYFDDRLWINAGNGDGEVSRLGPAFYSGVFVGYLLTDFIALGPKYLGNIFSVHHLSASAAWTMVATKRTMQWYASFLQFNELSTLVVNLRQVLLTAGYPSSSKPVMAASLGLFFMFGAVRVAPLPFIIHGWVTRDYETVADMAGTGIAVAASLFLAVHVSLQSFWFTAMARKFVSAIFGGTGGKDSKQKNE